MHKIETIIVQFLPDHVHYESSGKYKGKYLVQWGGVSDKPSKLGKLQVWESPYDTREEAQEVLKSYKAHTLPFPIFVGKK
jgi:hypothetical protein